LVKLFGFTEASDGSQVDDAVIIPYQNQLTAMQVRIQRLEEQSTVKGSYKRLNLLLLLISFQIIKSPSCKRNIW
jgi:hypothetical protein